MRTVPLDSLHERSNSIFWKENILQRLLNFYPECYAFRCLGHMVFLWPQRYADVLYTDSLLAVKIGVVQIIS